MVGHNYGSWGLSCRAPGFLFLTAVPEELENSQSGRRSRPSALWWDHPKTLEYLSTEDPCLRRAKYSPLEHWNTAVLLAQRDSQCQMSWGHHPSGHPAQA